MRFFKRLPCNCYLLFFFLVLSSCHRNEHFIERVDVLILGGGTGGTAAGLQSARLGARTLIVEPSPWLGGMLTAAGVSATDGNHNMPAGIWGAFRRRIYDYYGGPQAVATGWVSNTQFEPSVGARIFREMADAEPGLEVWLESSWRGIRRKDGQWEAEIRREGDWHTVVARILIDGTDLGDVAAAAGAAYDLGMEAAAETGERMGPVSGNEIIQDFTYVAILKDYGEGADRTMAEPEGYHPGEFYCSCAGNCDGSYDLPCEQMLNYGRLPGGKYMINWPNKGNDFYGAVVEKPESEREELYQAARNHTLRFVYYIQHELGFKHLGLADDEFPSADSLPFIPYHREGRRIRGLVRLDVNHILEPFEQEQPLYRTGIAVGDYPIDHHHDKNPEAPVLEFPSVPSFNIPAGALIPRDVDHLLVADKPVSVSNIVNGSSRLQPVVLQLGQAAGAMAALAAKTGVRPSELDLRTVQDTLLAAGAYLLPYYDAGPEHPHFAAIQRIGATGILRGTGEPYQWANRTWFHPDSVIKAAELARGLQDAYPGVSLKTSSEPTLTIRECSDLLYQLTLSEAAGGRSFDTPEVLMRYLEESWGGTLGLGNFDPDRRINRGEAAVLLDHLLDPFSRKIDWEGNWRLE